MADADVLFEEHRRGVFRYLSRIVGRVDAAHDLTQEVFLRVVRVRSPPSDRRGAKHGCSGSPAILRSTIFATVGGSRR